MPGEIQASPNFGRIVPIYRLRPKRRGAQGEELPEIRLRQNFLRGWVWDALRAGAARQIRDPLPENVRAKYALMNLGEALEQYHFPDREESRLRARRRLAFDDLFAVSMHVAARRVQL